MNELNIDNVKKINSSFGEIRNLKDISKAKTIILKGKISEVIERLKDMEDCWENFKKL